MSVVQKQQHLAGRMAGSRVGSHTVAHCILCSRQLMSLSTPPVLRRPSLIGLAASPTAHLGSSGPCPVPMLMCALSVFPSLSV